MLLKLIKYNLKNHIKDLNKSLIFLGVAFVIIVISAIVINSYGDLNEIIVLNANDLSLIEVNLNSDNLNTENKIVLVSSIIFVLTLTATILSTIAIFISIVTSCGTKFNKEIYGNLAYLTHSIPANTNTLVLSKLIADTLITFTILIIWLAYFIFMGVVLSFILTGKIHLMGLFVNIFQNDLSVVDVTGMNILSTIYEFVQTTIEVGIFILIIYTSIAIENQFKKNSGLSIFIAVILLVVFTAIGIEFDSFVILYNLILVVIMYGITTYLINKRLNIM